MSETITVVRREPEWACKIGDGPDTCYYTADGVERNEEEFHTTFTTPEEAERENWNRVVEAMIEDCKLQWGVCVLARETKLRDEWERRMSWLRAHLHPAQDGEGTRCQ